MESFKPAAKAKATTQGLASPIVSANTDNKGKVTHLVSNSFNFTHLLLIWHTFNNKYRSEPYIACEEKSQ